jgi:two-component system chemotaxis response regulator CheY
MGETSRKRVLVVDDAALVRLYYRGALEGHGFEVVEALNGIEGLEKLLAAPFDLLVVDVNMPQMDGLTFVETMRRQPLPLAATPVLVASTEAGPQDLAAARAAGANFYVVKPVGQDALAEYARMLCGVPA